jgi:rubredoxin
MSLKFRLRGLAETFVDHVICPECGHDSTGESEGFKTDHTKVTLSGIVVVVQCTCCSHVFIPSEQKFGIINSQRLQAAVERDCENTGQPIFQSRNCVEVEVERLNARRSCKMH